MDKIFFEEATKADVGNLGPLRIGPIEVYEDSGLRTDIGFLPSSDCLQLKDYEETFDKRS